MNILAIDTTTKKATVAIKANDNIIVKSIDNEITHSEKLLPLIDDILETTNVRLSDIDLLACTIGPGSFTGVRIGIATIKGLAKVLSKKIYGITSLELCALSGLKNINLTPEYVLSLMDAKNSRVYYNLYKYNNNSLTDTNIKGNLNIKDLIENLKSKNINNLLITGDVASTYSNLLTANFENAIINDSVLDLTLIFNNILNSSNYFDYNTLDATYYRNSEAERTKNGEK